LIFLINIRCVSKILCFVMPAHYLAVGGMTEAPLEIFNPSHFNAHKFG